MKNTYASYLAVLLAMSSSSTAAVLWTTTFSGSNNTVRTLINTSTGAFTDSLSGSYALSFNISDPSPLFNTGTGNTLNNFNPNKNVDNVTGAGWNSVFAFGAGSQSITLSDVTFNVYRFNSSGNTQATDANVRSVLINADFTLDGGASWTSLAAQKSVNLTNSVTSSPNIPLDFALGTPVAVNLATEDFRIRYTVTNDATNVGAYNGISSIAFSGSVVPEPSAALLGGLASLVLLRRRRI